MATDFTGTLEQLLQTYVKESDLAIEFASKLCDTSTRSLQRKLAEAGIHYSTVLDQVRFDAATKLLQDPEMSVTDVAHNLGYSDSSHFSRAFRRLAGVSPRAYRQRYPH